MESNGSSSMATVCGTTMSLMAAGVPMAKPVAGIAMGLIKEDDGRVAVLTDILGDEDHLGDMDFKVAGTKDGVTALQMDIKITSITKEIMEKALAQAHDGRIHILGEMAKAIEAPRPHVSDKAPRIIAIKIPVDKIREVIGSGGKVIREITEKTNSKIDISDDGVIRIATLRKKTAMLLWNGLWVLLPNRKKAKSIKVLLLKLWILVLLYVSSARPKGWFTSLKLKMRESLPFLISIKRVIPCGLNASARTTAVRLNFLRRGLIRKPVSIWKITHN